MKRARAAAVLWSTGFLAGATHVASDDLRIGVIDFYGLGHVPEGDARRALTVKEGDTIALIGDEQPAFMAESERHLAALPGVARARVHLVCCDKGQWLVYAGIEETGHALTQFRAGPKGEARLAADVIQAGRDHEEAFWSALQGGDDAEDDSQGHALSHDPRTRAAQERFIGYAARDLENLRHVLRDSSDAGQRALAAEVLGYSAQKQGVVADLVYGMTDPDANVRNNAMRALAVFAAMVRVPGQPVVRLPVKPFVGLLQSLEWTDRNKASLAIMQISESRDAALLARLRQDTLGALIEMARWKNAGHANAALVVLGRIGGQSEPAIATAIARGDRESLITAALGQR